MLDIWKPIFLTLTVLMVAAQMPGALAADETEMIEALKAQVEVLTTRLEALEAIVARPVEQTYSSPQTSNKVAAREWKERLRWKGDLRYRHESFDVEDRRDRTRQRIRARAALIADVNENVEVGFGLATGGDDPASTNQSLGDGFSTKAIQLDLAYARWASPIDGFDVIAGKFNNPFLRIGGNGLLWDGDLNPEGLALAFERGAWFGSAVGLWLNEESRDEDSYLVGVQGGLNADLGDAVALTAGIGYFNLLDLEGRPPIFDGDPRGNTLRADGALAYGYEELEAFAELNMDLGANTLSLFADYVTNLDASRYDTGYALGARLEGKHNDRSWRFEYAYQDLEADAVYALLADSDFAGGGTDGKGHIIKGGYALTPRIGLKGTLFVTERGGNAGSEHDYNRLQLDISFKY